MAKHVVIQDRQGDHTASVFLKESFRPVVLLWSYICIYVILVLTDSNTMASPILHLTPLDFNFWGHTKDLVYEVEINTKGQLQKRVTDAANQGVYSSISSDKCRMRHLSILVQILVFVFLNFVCDNSLSKTMRVHVGRINGGRLCKSYA
jgi:hypothetical protein